MAGVRLKLKRAWHQFDALNRDIKTFVDSGPYRPTSNFNKQTQRLTVKVNAHKLPDPMWGVRVGEVVHNFRSALDHIVWELTGRPSARTARTQFPIFETEARFTERGTKQFLKGVSSNAIRLIKSEQPFSARKDGTIEGTRSPL